MDEHINELDELYTQVKRKEDEQESGFMTDEEAVDYYAKLNDDD